LSVESGNRNSRFSPLCQFLDAGDIFKAFYRTARQNQASRLNIASAIHEMLSSIMNFAFVPEADGSSRETKTPPIKIRQYLRPRGISREADSRSD
jgi:hypothetical protein